MSGKDLVEVEPQPPPREREVLYTWDALIETTVLTAEVIG